MARGGITNRGMAFPDLDGYCGFSWSLCEKGEEIMKQLEEMCVETSDEWDRISQDYPKIMEDVLFSIEHMNEKLKEWYKYNEDLYNSVMRGAYYKDGEKQITGTPMDFQLRDYKRKDQ